MVLLAMKGAAAAATGGSGSAMLPLSTPTEEMTLCVVTQGRDEQGLLAPFVSHYLSEGAARVVVIDDRSKPPMHLSSEHARDARVLLDRYDEQPPDDRLEDIAAEECDRDHLRLMGLPPGFRQQRTPNRAVRRLRDAGCEWVAYADMDEFTFPRSGQYTLADTLRTNPAFASADVVHVPWLHFVPAAGSSLDIASQMKDWPHNNQSLGSHPVREWFKRHAPDAVRDPADCRLDLMTRYNYSLPHPHPINEVKWSDRPNGKSIVRVSSPRYLDWCHSAHAPLLAENDQGRPRCVSGLDGSSLPCPRNTATGMTRMSLPTKVREAQIERAILVQNHYRITSYASIERKCTRTDEIFCSTCQPYVDTEGDTDAQEKCMLTMLFAIHPEAVLIDTSLADRARRKLLLADAPPPVHAAPKSKPVKTSPWRPMPGVDLAHGFPAADAHSKENGPSGPPCVLASLISWAGGADDWPLLRTFADTATEGACGRVVIVTARLPNATAADVLSEPALTSEGVLVLGGDDAWDHLPEKMLRLHHAMTRMRELRRFTHVLKMDDTDVVLHLTAQPAASLIRYERDSYASWSSFGATWSLRALESRIANARVLDFAGPVIIESYVPGSWHLQAENEVPMKCPGSYWCGRQFDAPRLSRFLNGGATYLVSRRASAAIANNCTLEPEMLRWLYEHTPYEDVQTAEFLAAAGFRPQKFETLGAYVA